MKEKHAAWKGLMKTFLATTFSIVLTFGTASLIERHKQAKERRQIVLMIMYDLDKSLNQAQNNDALLKQFVETQTRIVENPAIFEDSVLAFYYYLPSMKYTETIENIFSSNIETIHTISNVHFVEKTSEFYQLRERYRNNIEEFLDNYDLSSYEKMLAFDACHHYVISCYLLADMKYLYLQCKQIMNVTDKEMEACYRERQEIDARSGEKENVFKTKVPQVQNPWREALKKSQETSNAPE